MCGISGIYHFNNEQRVSEEELIKMRDALAHRGPDGAANWISTDKKIGLSQRRLAIIDLSPEAACPMTASCNLPQTNCRNLWITFNGEIYNFKTLREELLKKGHVFKTKGDTEVILHGYGEWGAEVLNKLNGMFAFVIWDEKKKQLFAARDHIGIKPFYYAVQNGAFYFGSEIKAINANPNFKRELDEEGLSYYLTFGSSPAPSTLFKDIKKLPAAHYLIIKNGIVEEKEYWTPVTRAPISNSKFLISKNLEEYYIEKIRSLLKNSIKAQMVSDVPFGCFLSGGIDSSTNAVLMSEALGRPVETFSVGSNFEKYNEFQYSRRVAEFLGAKCHEIVIDENHLREFLSKLPYYVDDPNSDYICFPMFYLAKLTRESGVIVIQIGEGSDEIFAGYSTYLKAVRLYEKWWQPLSYLPAGVKKIIFESAKILPGARFDFHKEYLRRLASAQEPFWGLAIAFSDYQKEKLLTFDFKKRVPLSISYNFVKSQYDQLKNLDPQADFLKTITYLEVKHRLPELLLARADKMTMAHSVEGRVPFLDKDLVELTFTIPAALKLKNNETKYLLKKAMADTLPPEIIRRPKQGFSTPMNEWLKLSSPVAKEIFDMVFKSKIKERGIFNYDYIKKLIAADRHWDNAHIFRLWNIITLSLWHDYWF